ncbi:MAG: tetratricopeptide repeat protein [Bacteroidota bacterium]
MRSAKSLGLKGETASSLNNIGNIQVFFNNYSKALELYVEALKLAEELNDKKAMANAYNNIGMVYDYNGDLDKALDYYDRARAGFEYWAKRLGLPVH